MGNSKVPFPEILYGRGQPELREYFSDCVESDSLNVMKRSLCEDAGHIPFTKGFCVIVLFKDIIIPEELFIDFHSREFTTSRTPTQGGSDFLKPYGTFWPDDPSNIPYDSSVGLRNGPSALSVTDLTALP